MFKILFFDNRPVEYVRGFKRVMERPVKYAAAPLFIADQPWEHGNMQLYGSVVKAPDGPFQLWYSTIEPRWWIKLAYAESGDGIVWRKPLLDIYKHGRRKTNIVLADNTHGSAVIHDETDPHLARRYKLVAGAAPSDCISVFTSPDGVRWSRLRREPQIPYEPDCPMAFFRKPDGRYVVFHRVRPWGRRIFRSASWDLVHWDSEPRMILEPGSGDPPQLQFYGMGAAPYGDLEIGTLWAYHTDEEDIGPSKMLGYQETELAFSRSGYAWHRVDQGNAFIPHGDPGDWDCGNLQCASQPVFLDDEIRYYFMGTTARHGGHWELDPQTAGVGFASIKPDRFVALAAAKSGSELLTVAFALPSDKLFVNTRCGRGGWVKAEVADVTGKPFRGLTMDDCQPVTGDATSHALRWNEQATLPVGERIRLRVQAENARVYSLFAPDSGETEPAYWQFRSV